MHSSLLCSSIGLTFSKTKAKARAREQVDIAAWMDRRTSDITGDLVLGERFDCLANGYLDACVNCVVSRYHPLHFYFSSNPSSFSCAYPSNPACHDVPWLTCIYGINLDTHLRPRLVEP